MPCPRATLQHLVSFFKAYDGRLNGTAKSLVEKWEAGERYPLAAADDNQAHAIVKVGGWGGWGGWWWVGGVSCPAVLPICLCGMPACLPTVRFSTRCPFHALPPPSTSTPRSGAGAGAGGALWRHAAARA